MSSNPLFVQTITALLQGECICEVRYESLFNYLQFPAHQEKVDDHLLVMNRRLRQTMDRAGWVCAFADLSSPEAKAAVRHQFSEVANNLESLVGWMRLIMTANSNERPLAPGERLSEAEMLGRIEQVPALQNQLKLLTERGLFKNNRADSKGQLGVVTQKLVEQGYLQRIGETGSVYRATGKWGWLYDCMDFIRAHEDIPIQDDDANQLRAF